MPEIVVREAVGVGDIAVVRRLLRGYGDYLAANPAGAASICLEGYEQELEGLPGPYFLVLLSEVDGAAAGCVALRRVAKDESGCEMKRLWVDGDVSRFGVGTKVGARGDCAGKADGMEDHVPGYGSGGDAGGEPVVCGDGV